MMFCYRCNKEVSTCLEIQIRYRPNIFYSSTRKQTYKRPFNLDICHECIKSFYKQITEPNNE
jgi:hypothetical protein